jgi:hypothetical protein|tara:strand:+ start:3204 stop:3893 length:690 start_codon:yes stop_codon:yes gene_type:complete
MKFFYYPLLFVFLLFSCNKNEHFSSLKTGQTLHYDIKFIDKERKTKTFKQSYFLYKTSPKLLIFLRNDGKLVHYTKLNEGLSLKEANYVYSSLVDLPDEKLFFENNNILLKFPLKEGTKWENDDQTTLIMKLGYDRVFKTLLPIKIKSEIKKVDDVIKINGKTFKDCIKIESEGTTSWNPGPPQKPINIKVTEKFWYSMKYGLVKLIREEKSDSETMGQIFYEKSLKLN